MKRLSRKNKIAFTAAALVLLLGFGLAFATEQKVFSSGYEFQVVDPAQPIIQSSVNGNFINSKIVVNVNLSAYDGVKQLSGTYSIVLQLWNDTSNSYQPFQTLASNQNITLTPQPTMLHYTFTTRTPGTYNVDVEFTTTNVALG